MIYLLEDDESIRKLVTYTLQHAGYEAAGFERPSAFWAAMKRETPELVLLDIMLPEEDGLSVLQKLRGSALWQELPVMMMTAKNAEYDRVIGLDRLYAVHLNDSMNVQGSHKDRHQKIGQGEIGAEGLRRVVAHPLLQGKPFILETPNDDAGYAAEIAQIRSWMI